MDESIYKFFNWREFSDKEEFSPVDISDPANRKYFWNYWHTNKEYLKSKGFSIHKENDGNFYIYHTFDEVQMAEKNAKKETLELSRASDMNIEIPAPPGLSYFGYQKAGIHFINTRSNTLLADQQGLGKTVQVAGAINISNPKLNNVLIICPASLKMNWKRELELWLVDKYNIGIVNRSEYPDECSIVIINFDVVHKHHDKLTSINWDLLVIDEVHFLKSKSTRRSKYIFGSKKEKIKGIFSAKKIFLSGTPIVNKPIELFPIINVLDSETWPSQWSYAKRYCDPVHNGWGWDFSGASNLDELQDRLRSSIMIRRLKDDVLPELPPKFRQVIELPLDSKLEKLIKKELMEWEEREELISSLKSSIVLARINEDSEGYREAVSKLKDGMKASFTSLAKIRETVALSKLPYVVEHLSDIEGKVVVFAHHKSVIKKLKEVLGDSAVVLMGETSMADRQIAIDSFQNNPDIKYFIGSIMAAGVGITLTSSSHVVFAELDWVPGSVSQAEDRCVLEGQPVLTPDGWVNIENIKVGDLVISHDGKSYTVTDTFSRLARGSHAHNSKDIVEIEVLGWQDKLKFTSDHKVLTGRGWLEAGHIKPRDKILMPSPYEGDLVTVDVFNHISDAFFSKYGAHRFNSRLINLPNNFILDKESMFVFGYYIGDGFASTGKDKGRFVSMAGNKNQKLTHLRVCENWFNNFGVSCSVYDAKNSEGCELRAYSGNLAFWFENNFGRTLKTKKIPEWLFASSIASRLSFIEGWLASDGYIRRGRKEIITSSKVLAAQASRLVMSVGEKPCVYFNEHSNAYSISWKDGQEQSLTVSKVTLRTCTKSDRVYDLTVEDSHTFVVATAVVHNCHRIGQKNNVLVQHLVLEGSLDARMAKTLIKKQAVIDKALDKEYALEEPSVPDEIILPTEKEIQKESKSISEEEKIELLKNLKILASLDSDKAASLNGIGFNKFDSSIGHSLAGQNYLSDRQAVLARILVSKYRKQLND